MTLSTSRAGRSSTREQILDDALRLIQTLGYTNFSYADIAASLGVTNATIHYHFPTKADLGLAVIVRYRQRLAERLADASQNTNTFRDQFDDFVRMYTSLIEDDYLLCPGAMLAAETRNLPDEMRAEVAKFFLDQERWVADRIRQLAPDSSDGDIDARCTTIARHIVAALEGALIISRLADDAERFHSAVRCVITDLQRSLAELGIDSSAFDGGGPKTSTHHERPPATGPN
jgi:TetR/AcrR family transcriptional regulator, transcriptional repressor for nem operon